jgi:hypothetical protein
LSIGWKEQLWLPKQRRSEEHCLASHKLSKGANSFPKNFERLPPAIRLQSAPLTGAAKHPKTQSTEEKIK